MAIKCASIKCVEGRNRAITSWVARGLTAPVWQSICPRVAGSSAWRKHEESGIDSHTTASKLCAAYIHFTGLLVSSSVAATKQPEKNIATQSDSRWMSSLLMSTFCVLCVECTRACISTIHITHVICRTLQTYIQCYPCVCVLYSVHPREFISAVILAEILCLVLVCSFCVLLVNWVL